MIYHYEPKFVEKGITISYNPNFVNIGTIGHVDFGRSIISICVRNNLGIGLEKKLGCEFDDDVSYSRDVLYKYLDL